MLYNRQMISNKKNIAVLFGGKSPEHEVSIITGLQVLNHIDTEKYNPIPIYVAKDGTWYHSEKFSNMEAFKKMDEIPYRTTEVILSANPKSKCLIEAKNSFLRKTHKIKIDCFFPCFHGSYGENGAFQGLFEICEIPYVGSEILGSVLGIDKVIGKDVFTAQGISTAPYLSFHKSELERDVGGVIASLEKEFNYPMFVKPASGGSSIGVSKAKNKEELMNALELAALFDHKIIVEKEIENAREINVSVIGNMGSELLVSECEEVFHKGDFLTYEDKYKGGSGQSQGMASTKREIPAKLSPEAKKLINYTAKKVFNSLNCFGLARVDFLIKENPLEVFVIEINTIPGSMAFYLWEAGGISFKEMTSKLIELAEKRFGQKNKNIHTFESNILKDYEIGLKTPKLN